MEQWERWVPIDNIPETIYNQLLLDNEDGLTLEFSDEEQKTSIKVLFEGFLCYRNRDEGSCLKTIEFLHKNYPLEYHAKYCLFKVFNSAYLHWFLDECEGLYEPFDIQHYVFFTPNDVIEVLSLDVPKVTVE